MPALYEVVSINRLDATDQKIIGKFEAIEPAKTLIEERKQTEPLRYMALFTNLSSFCRLLCYHTL